jgi:hypothetical protein
LSLGLTEHRAMKTYWGSGGTAPRILGLGTRWKWVVSFTPQPLYPEGKRPRYPLHLMAESYTICSSCSRQQSRNFWIHPHIYMCVCACTPKAHEISLPNIISLFLKKKNILYIQNGAVLRHHHIYLPQQRNKEHITITRLVHTHSCKRTLRSVLLCSNCRSTFRLEAHDGTRKP